MKIKNCIKLLVLLFAGLISFSANATTIDLTIDDAFGVYAGNDGNADQFEADTGLLNATEVFRLEFDLGDFTVTKRSKKTSDGLFEGVIDTFVVVDYIVVKFNGVYGVYDVTSYADYSSYLWDTADFFDACVALEGKTNNCSAGLSHITGYVLNAVPVPASMLLFASGLIGLVSVARRKA